MPADQDWRMPHRTPTRILFGQKLIVSICVTRAPQKPRAHGHKSVHKVKFSISFFMYFVGGVCVCLGGFGGVPVCRSPRHDVDFDFAARGATKMSATESQTSKNPIWRTKLDEERS